MPSSPASQAAALKGHSGPVGISHFICRSVLPTHKPQQCKKAERRWAQLREECREVSPVTKEDELNTEGTRDWPVFPVCTSLLDQLAM